MKMSSTSTYRINNQNLKNAFDLLDYNREGEVDIPAVLENLKKMGYEDSHPEIFDLISSLGEGKINYSDYLTSLSDIMIPLKRGMMYDDSADGVFCRGCETGVFQQGG